MEQAFETIFDDPPRWIASAPGRVNLIGEHTDYNDGFVMPMAIERHTMIAASPNDSDCIVLRSTAFDEAVRIELDHPIIASVKGSWANYPKGVIAGFQRLGRKIPGFNALIDSTVPMGGGLSSSAALEVAMATLLETMTGALDRSEKALLCQTAELDFAGTPCGIMDQFISTFARKSAFMMLDCRELQTQWLEVDDPSIAVLIFDTRIKHEHSAGEYAARRRECKAAADRLGINSLRDVTLERLEVLAASEPTLFRRARHVVTENGRTLAAAACIRAGDWKALGELMYQSHASLRDDFEVSCLELDAAVSIARELGREGGIYGCRMTGGGFGGCAVALIDADVQHAIMDRMARIYLVRTGIEPTLFVSRPADGARMLKAEALTS